MDIVRNAGAKNIGIVLETVPVEAVRDAGAPAPAGSRQLRRRRDPLGPRLISSAPPDRPRSPASLRITRKEEFDECHTSSPCP